MRQGYMEAGRQGNREAGGGLFAKFPDIYGRKKMIAITLTLLFLTSSASAFAQTKEQFFILRCLSGVCMGITYPTCNSFTAEIVKSTHREVGPMLCTLFFNISVFLAAVLAYLFLNTLGWRWFVFVMAVPLLVCLVLLVCLLPESPRYLAVSGRKKEAMEALRRMAKVNGVSLPENLKIAVRSDRELGSISDILKSDYRKETILLSTIHFGNLLILFGTIVFVPLALYSGFCGGEGDPPVHKCVEVQQNSLLELSIVTFACVLSTFVGYGTSIIMGRSISLKIFATVSFITSIFLFKCFSNFVTVGLFFVMKFMQVSHNMVTLIIIPELYPTTFRNTAMGFINSWGKLGGVVGAGAVYALYYYSPMLVVVMFSGAALMVTVASWIWNKETKVSKGYSLKNSKDPKVKEVYEHRAKKQEGSSWWGYTNELIARERDLYFRELVGETVQGMMGLGSKRSVSSEKEKLKELVSHISEQDILLTLVDKGVQGQFLTWENTMQLHLGWNNLIYNYKMSPALLKFHTSTSMQPMTLQILQQT
ncbi:uncharacterized protein LOC134813834 [Bolinopsis microptera]|uniref:uncharacterized protein LOC134813834 n=1 Tax=Bolinopsis microptera TaxID=2820187 RepID=UPI003079DEBF